MKTEIHSVIKASFVDYKRYVRQNKTIFHIEVPIEYTNKYISILGEPTAANPISVAVARLNLQDDIPAINLPVMELGEGGGGDNSTVHSGYDAPTADFDDQDWKV